MNLARRIVRRCLPRRSSTDLNGRFAHRSYAGEGEDRVMYRLLQCDSRSSGFYVDVGAHHPQRYSNTFAFYQKGWSGINIDARPGAMALFNRDRPRDINLERAISDVRQTLTYYEFNDPALNGFCAELASKHNGLAHFKIVGTRPIQTVTLAEVLDQHLPAGQAIDFLTIDVEGMDGAVLRSNDWDRFRPAWVLAEDLEFPGLERAMQSEVVRYLHQHGYELFSKTYNTLFFRDRARV